MLGTVDCSKDPSKKLGESGELETSEASSNLRGTAMSGESHPEGGLHSLGCGCELQTSWRLSERGLLMSLEHGYSDFTWVEIITE